MHQTLTADKLREAYLSFFEKQGHARIPSASLVPENDPTTLFTGSGMQPMVPYLLGEKHPKGTRIVDSQKAFRSQDIEEVGDNRHTTYFEMLGNWSLGDYFKSEQLEWFFSFLVDEIGLNPEQIFVTVFRGNTTLGIERDDESVAIWQKLFAEHGITAKAVDSAETEGLQDGRIFYYDESKNWWSRAGEPSNMPPGEPGGPDSEVFYDFGLERQLHEHSPFKNEPCHVNCDCGRFLEIGNSVFMQYQKQSDGSFTPLPQQNVDFGGGLERILAAAAGEPDVFKIDLLWPIITQLEAVTGKTYLDSEVETASFRVIADHLRAAVLLIADGVKPSNKEQGYFLRRLIRRSIRHGKMLGVQEAFLAPIVPVVTQLYTSAYPDVLQQTDEIAAIITEEETRFMSTLSRGLRQLQHLARSSKKLSAKAAFELYETHGFPLELTKEVAQDLNLQLEPAVPEDFQTAFESAKKEHAAASRDASAGKFKGGLQDAGEITVKYHTATHLLHAALRTVLGTHVEQKGSNITQDRLRFDFSHSTAVTQAERQHILELINDWIKQDLPVHTQTMDKQAALDSGAIAFFVEKYPDTVTVYTIGKNTDTDWISKELCGGPHVSSTGEIGQLHWKKEQAVGAGVRRVYLEL
ncbi:MAG: alanine--tRNA ligase [Patescibacteria group bacterium]